MGNGQTSAAAVAELKRAYQGAIGAASELPYFERLIVISAIADHANATSHHLAVAVPDGERVRDAVEAFAKELDRDDRLADLRRIATNWAGKAKKQVVSQVFITGLGPTITSVFGALAAWSGALRSAGAALGAVLAAFLVAGASVLTRYPHLLTHAARAGAAAGRGAGNVGERIGGFVAALGGLGSQAEALLAREVWPQAQKVAPGIGAGRAIPAQVRGVAQALAWAMLIVTVICSLIFGAGVVDGLTAEMESRTCVPSAFRTCP